MGNMEHLGLLKPTACFLEFGAGKGGLSRSILTGLGSSADRSAFVLVDRAGGRNKVHWTFFSSFPLLSFSRIIDHSLIHSA